MHVLEGCLTDAPVHTGVRCRFHQFAHTAFTGHQLADSGTKTLKMLLTGRVKASNEDRLILSWISEHIRCAVVD